MIFWSAGAHADQTRQRILFLSSNHPAHPAFFPQVNGLRAGLAENGFTDRHFTLDLEFMDTKRFEEDSQVPYFAGVIARKLRMLDPYDVIVAADDAAFAFAVDSQESIFRGTPIVFLGVNRIDAARKQEDNPKVTGVVERVMLAPTLKLAEHLYPLSSRIVGITGASPVGLRSAQNLRRAEGTLRHLRVEHYSLAEHSYAELETYLSRLDINTPVLFLTAYQDKTGEAREYQEVLAMIKRAYQGAVFVGQKHAIGTGTLGGHVVDQELQGLAAGRLAARVLNDGSAAAMPIAAESGNVTVIDYAEASRLGFRGRDFPPGTHFINRDASVFDRYRDVILLTIVIGALQMAIIVMLFLNVRRRRAAEAAANQARIDAEIANKAKTEFLANMSHELRTPLNSVIGFSDVLLADRVGAINEEKRKEYLSDIRESGIFLLNLLNSILDVAKIEMGRLEIDESDIDVGQVLSLCHRLVSERAADAGLHLSLDVADDLPGLNADPTRLKQSVLNLLSNAIKFSEPGGSIHTRAQLDADGNLRIIVRDTGPGIPASELSWVMEPFNRGRSRSVAAKEGSGIGLALTASLMESHGGRLDLESEVGAGTTAILIFPAERLVRRRERRAKIA